MTRPGPPGSGPFSAAPLRSPHAAATAARAALASTDPARLSQVYRDLHRHPELAFQEERTAATLARRLSAAGAGVVTAVGGTGVVGVLANGEGSTVLLRADMDGLPMSEETGLTHSSVAAATDAAGRPVDVMHGCGHDIHVTALIATVDALAAHRDLWRGTVIALGQPAEEIGEGARAMIRDGLYDRFGVPDVALAQHSEAFGEGAVAHRSGLFSSGALSLDVRIPGRGGHASTPDVCIDPIVTAAAIITRLQTVVAREVPAADPAVVTVGSIHAGSAANSIPSEVDLSVNIRFQSAAVRERILTAVYRIIRAECAASGSSREPTIREYADFPCMTNDDPVTAVVRAAHVELFGAAQVYEVPVSMGSEDFAVLSGPDLVGSRVPSCYWLAGVLPEPRWAGTSSSDFATRITELPGLHSARFAPDAERAPYAAALALACGALAVLPPR